MVTGRRQSNAYEDARLLGCSAYVFELGCALVLDGELEWLTDGLVPSEDEGTIHDQIAASGAPAILDEAFPQFEPHLPWSEGREVSHLFRGSVDVREANALLAESGLDWLRLVDNGVLTGGLWPYLGAEVHCYHLMPGGASKLRGVARHMQNRGYAPEECIAVGDSREDMEMVSTVGTFWLVGNGAERDPALSAEARSHPRVRVCEDGFGAGVYEAVISTLAGG